jgi:hypothetical protein
MNYTLISISFPQIASNGISFYKETTSELSIIKKDKQLQLILAIQVVNH